MLTPLAPNISWSIVWPNPWTPADSINRLIKFRFANCSAEPIFVPEPMQTEYFAFRSLWIWGKKLSANQEVLNC